MLVKADPDLCIGAGQCVLTAPDVFDQDEEFGTVVLLQESVAAEHEGAVREAVSACPARAIAVDA